MIKKLKPLFILLGAFALSYLLWFLGQVQPDPVEELPPPDVIVEILTPNSFDIVVHNVASLTFSKFGTTILLCFRSTLLKIIPEFGADGKMLILTLFPVCTPTPEKDTLLAIVD